MVRLPLKTLLALPLAIWLTGCGPKVDPPEPVFVAASGSTSLAPLIERLAEAYHQRQPLVTIEVDGGGSQVGRVLAADGQVELGLISDGDSEVPAGLRAVTVARDGIAVIVHPSNPLTGLTLAELRDMYAGRTFDWSQLDPAAASWPIQLVSREDGSGTRAVFETRAMESLRVSPTAVVMPNSQAVLDYVAAHPQATGYVSAALVDDRVRAVAIEDVEPLPASLTTGEYPLTRELRVLFRVNAPAEVRGFLDFALSPAGQVIVGEQYGRVR